MSAPDREGFNVSISSCWGDLIESVQADFSSSTIHFQCNPDDPLKCGETLGYKVTILSSLEVSKLKDCVLYYTEKFTTGPCYQEWLCPATSTTGFRSTQKLANTVNLLNYLQFVAGDRS